MFCEKCGKLISDDANFCRHCGSYQKGFTQPAEQYKSVDKAPHPAFTFQKSPTPSTVSSSSQNTTMQSTSDLIKLIVGKDIAEGTYKICPTNPNGGILKIFKDDTLIKTKVIYTDTFVLFKNNTRINLYNCKIKTGKPRAKLPINPKSILLIIGFIAILIAVIHFANKEDVTDYTTLPSHTYETTKTTTTTKLPTVPEPESGDILYGKEYENESKLTISASSNESCVVKLKTSSGTEILSFYVRAGQTASVGVPCEKLYVYFATGRDWYGEDKLFGENRTSYSKDSNICNFAEYTASYTLYPVSDGNFEETPISADEFKN